MKSCKFCKKLYKKHKKFSEKQWQASVFCSLTCFGKHKLGITHTIETRKKLSVAHKGTKKPWAGKYKRTDKQKANIAISLKKFYLEHPEERTKISQRTLNRKHTTKAIEKMKIAQTLRPNYRGGESTRLARRSFYQQQREFRKRSVGGRHSFQEWNKLKENYKFTCPACKKSEPEIKLTEDHIIPISLGGKNTIENIQPLCQPCNSHKSRKIIKYERTYSKTENISTK